MVIFWRKKTLRKCESTRELKVRTFYNLPFIFNKTGENNCSNWLGPFLAVVAPLINFRWVAHAAS